MSSGSLRMLPPAGRLARLRRDGSPGHQGAPGELGSFRLMERHARVYRHAWVVFASGLFEPLFYLLSVGLGLGVLVGKVPGPGGQLIPYREFVAPGLLAVSSMNGATSPSREICPSGNMPTSFPLANSSCAARNARTASSR